MKKIRFFLHGNFCALLLYVWLLLIREHDLYEADIEALQRKSISTEYILETTKTPVDKAEKEEPMIKVVLMTNDFQGYFHETVHWRNGEKEGKIDRKTLEENSYIIEGSPEGITILSLDRAEGHPIYQGKIEIRKEVEGLLLINELPLETYLESVVPSEMPAEYEMEALKAQAVCARTYACRQIQEKRMERYYADVDDSVNCQVYGNYETGERSTQAVKETKGRVLSYGGELIQAYYFSTSSGKTNTDEIWGTETASPYLQSVSCSFDEMLPWYKWKTEIEWDILQERFLVEFGEGILKNIEIIRKSQGGSAIELQLQTETDRHLIKGEYKIREFLKPSKGVLLETTGEYVQKMSLLPSACIAFDICVGESIKIEGNGYGHGVGMSQNGANEMAKQGYSWEEILKYFFKNIQIDNYRNFVI